MGATREEKEVFSTCGTLLMTIELVCKGDENGRWSNGHITTEKREEKMVPQTDFSLFFLMLGQQRTQKQYCDG